MPERLIGQGGARVFSEPGAVPRRAAGRPPLPHGHLAYHQLCALQLVADGCTDQQVARQLGWTPRTAQKVMQLVRAALDADSRAHAVAIGIRRGLIS